MLYQDYNASIRDIFKQVEGVSQHGLEQLYDEDVKEGKRSYAQAIVDEGLASREDLFSLVAQFLGYELQIGEVAEIEGETLKQIEAEVARKYKIVPLYLSEGGVHYLADDPFNSSIIDDLTFALDLEIHLIVCDPGYVEDLLDTYYAKEESTMGDLLGQVGLQDFEGLDETKENDLTDAANETPIIRFVNLVIQQAIRAQASDIHFEPFEEEFKIRYRVDGALYEMSPPPKSLALPVISRIKVIADLNIAEHRIPQDGRIKLTIEGRAVDLRFPPCPPNSAKASCCVFWTNRPSIWISTTSAFPKTSKRAFGTRSDARTEFSSSRGRPARENDHLTALREVNEVETKLLTAEDPVEYELEGIMQVPVNHQVGLDFARALRAFLRQDPDKIMVGRSGTLRPPALPFRLPDRARVLSTLHTNDAPGAITRLIDMGLEPFLLSASLEFVLAQRLVRKICSACKQDYEPAKDLIENLGLNQNDIGERQFFYGAGCEECNQSGYRGRTGLFEMIKVTDGFREMINSGAATLVLRQKAIEQGMRTLREDGVRSIFDGESTVEEVLKYT